MKVSVIAVGLKIPAWAQTACDDYLSRFPSNWSVDVKLVRAEDRSSKPIPKIMEIEAEHLRAALPKDAIVVIMDERGKDLTSVAFAQQMSKWSAQGRPVAFIIGGADGIDPNFKKQCAFMLRLSSLTLPHAMARVLLLEQIYRCWSLMNNHPYHRA